MTEIWLIGTLSLTPINHIYCSCTANPNAMQEPYFCEHKGADQSAHTCRLISAYVIQFSERITSKFASSKISII